MIQFHPSPCVCELILREPSHRPSLPYMFRIKIRRNSTSLTVSSKTRISRALYKAMWQLTTGLMNTFHRELQYSSEDERLWMYVCGWRCVVRESRDNDNDEHRSQGLNFVTRAIWSSSYLLYVCSLLSKEAVPLCASSSFDILIIWAPSNKSIHFNSSAPLLWNAVIGLIREALFDFNSIQK